MSLFSLFSQSVAKDNYIFFDVETTGLHALDGDRVIELAMLKVSCGEIVDQLELLFNPGKSIPPEVTAINNITNEMIAGSPAFDLEMCRKVKTFIENYVLVAHNAPFDLGFISSEFARSGIIFDGWNAIDTLRIASSIFPGQRHRLSNLLKIYNIPPDGDLHRALNDTVALKKVFFEMLDEAEIRGKTLEQIIKKYGVEGIYQPRSMPAKIREALIEKKLISGQYKKRTGDLIPLSVVPLAPVWSGKRWFFYAEDSKTKELLTLNGESFIKFDE
jgi:DNA polymerase III epsilon subunit family exonuclease